MIPHSYWLIDAAAIAASSIIAALLVAIVCIELSVFFSRRERWSSSSDMPPAGRGPMTPDWLEIPQAYSAVMIGTCCSWSPFSPALLATPRRSCW